MDSVQLLIIDRSPESAEELSSLLRNSGINVHALQSDSISAAQKAIKQYHPILLIYNAISNPKTTVTAALELAHKHAIPAAVRILPSEPEALFLALDTHSCLALNAQDSDQLVDTVIRMVEHEKRSGNSGNVQAALEELQQRYQLLLESSRESIAYIHEGLHIYANRAYLDLLRVREFEDIAAISLLEMVQTGQGELKTLLRAIQDGNFPEEAITLVLKTPPGDELEVRLNFSPALFDGEQCVQLVVTEIDAHTALKRELDHLRKTDQLTQMMNRRTFSAELQKNLPANSGNTLPGFVLYLEPDSVHELHNQLGPTATDEFIQQFANIIRENTSSIGFPGRYSDFGFLVFLEPGANRTAGDLAENLLLQFSENGFITDGNTISVTASIGIATVGPLTRNSEDAIREAVMAYRQAAQEPNSYRQYAPTSVNADNAGDTQWAERIRYALNTKRLYSVQQPIVNLEGDPEGLYENRTFIREDNCDLAAEVFMGHAEQSNLGAAIDRFVLPGLLKTIAGSGDRHIFNLSTNSILDFSFPSWFQNQMSELGVEGSQVILQFTAGAAESHQKPLWRLINELAPLGCRFSLSMFEDYRQGGAILGSPNVAMVKLPPGLSQALASNSENQRIVRNIVSVANNAQAEVIADEILDAADLAVLWQCGVKLVAGEFLKDTSTVVTA